MIAVLGLIRRSQAALAIVLGTLTVLSGAALLAASGALITGAALRPENLLVLMPLITAVRLFGVSRAVLRYAERLVSHDLSLQLVARLRIRLLERLIPLSPAVLTGVRSGELLARIRADVDEVQGVFVRLAAPATVAVLAGGVAVGLTALVSPPTALVLAVLLAVLGVAVPAWAHRAGSAAARSIARADAAYRADVLDTVSGLADLVTGDRTGIRRGLTGHLEIHQMAERRLAGITAVTTFLREAVPGVGLVAALWLIGDQVYRGDTHPMLLAAVALGVLGAFESVGGLGAAWAASAAIRAAVHRVDALGLVQPAVSEPAEPRRAPTDSSLAFDGVVLAYSDTGGPAGSPVDLRLAAGDKLALIGRSGVGKSSMLALAMRFRDPVAGRVLVGGTDLRELRLTDVRALFAWSAQSPQIIGGTLASNLLLARTDLTDTDLEAALLRVELDPLLTTVGLHGWIGESGERLSAGERARLGIARALLSTAPVVLLDEPTAHLDAELAGRILALLAAERRTVLIATHTAELCDERWRRHLLA